MKFVLPLVVWGAEWVRRAKLMLASLDSPGNLPDVDCKLVIYTNEPQEFVGYDIRPWPLQQMRKHKVTSSAFKSALDEFQLPLAPLAPDMICSEGVLATIEKHLDKRLVLAPVPRVNEKTFVDDLPKDRSRIALKPRELAALAMKHQHEFQTSRMFLDRIPSRGQPTTIFRRVGDTLGASCFHMHPVLFNPENQDFGIYGGIDGVAVNEIPDEHTHIVTDSDEGLVVDMSDPAYDWNGRWINHVWPVVSWAKRVTLSKHRRLFQTECYIHSDGVNTLPPDERLTKIKQEISDLDKLLTP